MESKCIPPDLGEPSKALHDNRLEHGVLHHIVRFSTGNTPSESSEWLLSGRPTYANELYHFSDMHDIRLIHTVIEDLSKPRKKHSPEILEALRAQGNTIKIQGATYTFDEYGRQIKKVEYNGEETDPFVVERILTQEYDEEGYVIESTVMRRGKIGFTRKVEYEECPDGRKVPIRVVTQNVKRQGIMEIGPDLGEPEIFDLRKYQRPPETSETE